MLVQNNRRTSRHDRCQYQSIDAALKVLRWFGYNAERNLDLANRDRVIAGFRRWFSDAIWQFRCTAGRTHASTDSQSNAHPYAVHCKSDVMWRYSSASAPSRQYVNHTHHTGWMPQCPHLLAFFRTGYANSTISVPYTVWVYNRSTKHSGVPSLIIIIIIICISIASLLRALQAVVKWRPATRGSDWSTAVL